MSQKWISGRRFLVCAVCAHDTVDVRLRTTAVTERPVNGYAPHLVFVPEYGHNRPDLVGGELDQSDPAEYRLNLAPTYFPTKGQLWLDGGIGLLEYAVSFKRRRCSKPQNEWAVTLRDLTAGLPAIKLPHGVHSISAPRDVSLSLVHAGDTLNLLLAAGLRFPLDHHSLGTINAAVGVVEALTCHVRL